MPKGTVLVVDDNEEMVATLSRYLGDHDWEVRTALGGAEAIEDFALEPADVVLTDLRMKGTDGIDVLEGVRRIDEQTPVVLMTAFGSVESAVDAIQRGAYNYVTKPFKMTAVRALLERAGSIRRARPNLPRSSSRKASGSMIAVPRSSAAKGAARAGKPLHVKTYRMTRNRNARLMSQ